MPPQETEQTRWFVDEVHAHDATLKRYLRRSFPAVRDVDDVVQESYLRLWRRQLVRPITEVTGSVTASVKGFLFQIARRLAVDTLRHEQASPIDRVTDFSDSAVIDSKADSHERACTNQEFELLLAAIDTLPSRGRQVVILRKLRGLSAAETALELGISEETVHVHTRRSMLKVQDYLRQNGVVR